MNVSDRSRRSPGFTLIEMLVVILIVVLLTAATLPVVIPAINQRKVSSAALIVQAELSRIRDAAIRANAPRGIRLLPEAELPRFAFHSTGAPGGYGLTPAYTRMIAIEPGPEYSEGLVTPGYPATLLVASAGAGDFATYVDISPDSNFPTGVRRIVVSEAKFSTVNVGGTPVTIPNPPTNWFWNVRRGDKIRFNSSGRTYTIAGPVLKPNPEDFINFGPPSPPYSNFGNLNQEFLFLVNGQDDNANGYTDEGLDGIDNDKDGFIDPGYNGLDENGNGLIDETAELAWSNGAYNYGEFEVESLLNVIPPDSPYTIYRRPVPSPYSREVALPTGVAIDMTSWNAGLFTIAGNPPQTFTSERSRLPVDPFTGYIDIMIAPNGQVIEAGATSTTSLASPIGFPFYHFWICDADDVFDPTPISGVPYLLPMPNASTNYPNVNDATGRVLKGERRLVSLNTRTGQITTSSLENFDATSLFTLDRPYLQAQAGVKEEP